MANILTNPESFNTGWNTNQCTIGVNSAVAPDGTTTMDSIIDNVVNTGHRVDQLASGLTNGQVYVASVFAKPAAKDWLLLFAGNEADGYYFDLSSGEVGSALGTPVSGKITGYGDGVFRCEVVFTNLSTTESIQIYAANADNDFAYPGASSAAVYIWGAYLNAGAEAETYVSQAGITVTPDTLQARRRNIIKRRRANAALARPRKELWAGRPVNNPKYR